MTLTLKELAAEIGAELSGEGETTVSSAATLEEAGPGQVSFLANPKYIRQVETTRASAVVVAPNVKPPAGSNVAPAAGEGPVLRLHPGGDKTPRPPPPPARRRPPRRPRRRRPRRWGRGRSSTPARTSAPGRGSGRDCVLYPNAVVYDDCVLGDRVIVHAGASVGQDGFGYATHRDPDGEVRHHKIPQVGNVVLEDDVEIGANTSIARSALGSTFVGRGSKIDANVVLGHGVKVGPYGAARRPRRHRRQRHARPPRHPRRPGRRRRAPEDRRRRDDRRPVRRDGGRGRQGDSGRSARHAGPARQRVYSVFTQLPELLDRVKQLEQQLAEMTGTAKAPAAEGDGIERI